MQTERVRAADLERAEARLPQWMAAVGVAGTLLVLASGHGRLAAGFALGSVIGIVNYYWLHQAIATLFDVGYMNVAPPFIARPEGNEGTAHAGLKPGITSQFRTLPEAARVRVPRMVVLKFLVRYPLAFAGIYVVYRIGWLPLAAIMTGLFVPVAGILIEATFQLREALRGTEGDWR